MLLALGAMTVTTGMLDAMAPPTAGTLIETVTVMATAALLEGAEDLAVGERQLGIALQVLRREGDDEVTEGGHESNPCMRVLRR
jgi:hypothetical protein